MLKNLVQGLLRGAGGESAAAADAAALKHERLHQCIIQAARHAAECEHAAAIALYRECLSLQPDDPRLWCNLGAELDADGQGAESERSYRRAIELDPSQAQAWYNLGRLLQKAGRTVEAESCYREAIARVDAGTDHDLWLLIHSNLGLLLYDQGRPQEALALYRGALAMRPQAGDLGSNLLFALNSVPGLDPRAVREEHAAWGRLLERSPFAHAVRAADPVIRVGYVSADFRSHALASFVEPVLRLHDRAQFRVICYNNGARHDAVTQRVQASSDLWRDIRGLDDDAVAQAIRDDRIDILVDVSGHTSGNRLALFARKPAPVQASYLGYLNTTGLAAMDYRITDACADPAGVSDQAHTERLLRLPRSLWCYAPPADAPAVCAPPALERGYVTFASFNHIAKLNRRVLDLWAVLLRSVPGSRLLVLAVPDEAAAARIRSALEGVDPGRVSTLGRLGRAEYWRQFAGVDIALDPFPYSGGATTCETLWMGVPVVTLAGDYGFSRSAATILANTGMVELIASTAEAYLGIARGLARDPEALRELRQSLRPRMLASPLLDAPAYVQALEAAYRQMWRTWRERQDGVRA